MPDPYASASITLRPGTRLNVTANLATAFADEYTTATLQTSGDNNLLPLGTPATNRKFWRLKLELHRGVALYY